MSPPHTHTLLPLLDPPPSPDATRGENGGGRGDLLLFFCAGHDGNTKKGLKVDLLLSLFGGREKRQSVAVPRNGMGGGGGGCMFNSGRWLSFEGCEEGRPF